MKTNVAVIGGGSWATALIKILSEGEVRINWWLRNEADVAHISQYGHNPSYLSGVKFDLTKVIPTTQLQKALEEAEYVILAVPAAFVRGVLERLPPETLANKRIVSAIKGMIPQENLLITDWLEKYFRVSPANLSCIAGPCHAEEVALERQSYLTIASPSLEHSMAFAGLLSCRYVKATAITDLYGVEYCAVMKNIIALASGICHGLGYGDNFQAVLVANALQEINDFVDVAYPYHRELTGSAYLGDLLVTAYSQFSRNRTFGNMIGKGYGVRAAQLEMNMVAEGYYATECIWQLNRTYQVPMPITEATYQILYAKKSPKLEIEKLREILR